MKGFIYKGDIISVHGIRTDGDAMSKKTKKQPMVHSIVKRKLKIDQYKLRLNSGSPEVYAFLAPILAPVALFILENLVISHE